MTTMLFQTVCSRPAMRLLAVGCVTFACAALAPTPASADIVTGTVSPASAKVVIVDASGKTVAELKPGAYQVQLPVGKYQAKCSAPKQKTVDVLVLSEPVTLNVDCG
jgi:hypothetical protein